MTPSGDRCVYVWGWGWGGGGILCYKESIVQAGRGVGGDG